MKFIRHWLGEQRNSIAEESSDYYPRYIPISADSRDILKYIDQPLEARRPVAYDRGFLEDYEPNKTFYLSEPLRRQLYKMGDTQQTKLPVGTYLWASDSKQTTDRFIMGIQQPGRQYLFAFRHT